MNVEKYYYYLAQGPGKIFNIAHKNDFLMSLSILILFFVPNNES